MPIVTVYGPQKTAQTLMDTARNRYLLSGSTEQRNQLSVPYVAGSGTLSFAYPLNGIQAGATLSVGTNIFYVWSVNPTGNSATVSGGQKGSADVSAVANSVVLVNPKWTDWDLFTALNEELYALASLGLYQMKQMEFTYNAALVGYDLAGVTDLIDIYEVRYKEANQYQRTPRLQAHQWRLERQYLTTENSSTLSLKVYQAGWPGQPVTVVYKSRYGQFVNSTDDAVTATGMDPSTLDILPLGIALRVGAGREVRRMDITSQGDTRRAEEVPPGASGGAWRNIQALYLKRISDEIARLAGLYPPYIT